MKRRPNEFVKPPGAMKLPLEAAWIDGKSVRFELTYIEETKAQIRENCAKGLAPLEKDRAERTQPLAIVGYGPSLHSTWERLRDWPGPVWTVSKAHDFLVERGIVPAAHVDVDPGEHKKLCIQRPQPGVEYWLATKVTPRMVEALPAEQVRLFHVDIPYPELVYDRRYPLFEAHFDATFTAAEIGFKRCWYDMHFFGLDYGMPGGTLYAGVHESPPKSHQMVPIKMLDGQIAQTSLGMSHGLGLAERFFCRRRPIRPVIHGNGLLGRFLTQRGRCKVEIRE